MRPNGRADVLATTVPCVYWFGQSSAAAARPLDADTRADAVVVGGGIAGLSAAQWLREERGLDVVLLEAGLCGSGATGHSSGFITPDSEFELNQLARRFGDDDAALLWRAARDSCDRIRGTINRFSIPCDLIEADSLYIAASPGAAAAIREEHEAHQRLGFDSRLYSRADLHSVLRGRGYHAGIRTSGTFGINGFAYAQGLKRALAGAGARIHEHSPVVELGPASVRTARARVDAPVILLCLDRFAPDLGIAPNDVYHAQAFILLSEPLSESAWQGLFPDGPVMAWDTDLVYQYFRRTAEGRLLIGGGLLRETYAARENPRSDAFAALQQYASARLPDLGPVRFTHRWTGLIGISKDILPIAGQSPREPAHYLALCSAGLPWSVLAGRAAAAKAIEGDTTFDRYFSPARAYSTIEPLQPILGRVATWALSYYLAKNYERGASGRVARRQRALTGAMLAGAAAAGFVVGRGLSRNSVTALPR